MCPQILKMHQERFLTKGSFFARSPTNELQGFRERRSSKMACFVSLHVKIRRAPEDTHAQARNFAERSTNASRVSLGMSFRAQSTKLHFVVPRGTPNDSSVKHVYSWFPDFVQESVFTISHAVLHSHDIQNLGF